MCMKCKKSLYNLTQISVLSLGEPRQGPEAYEPLKTIGTMPTGKLQS